MIECLLMKKPIRDFLKSYSQEKWKEIIPEVVEVGVLSLLNSFNKSIFTKEEFKEILTDLRNNEYYPKGSEYATVQKLTMNKSRPIQNRENDYYPREANPIEEQKTNQSHHDCDRRRSKPQIPTSIYPSWWGNYPEDKKRKQHNKKKHNHHNHHHHKNQDSLQADDTNQENINHEEIENPANEELAKNTNEVTSVKMNETNAFNHLNRKKESNSNSNQTKTNYKISYDKDLNPNAMEKKTNEPIYSYSYNENGLQRSPSEENMYKMYQNAQNDQNDQNSNQTNANNMKHSDNNKMPPIQTFNRNNDTQPLMNKEGNIYNNDMQNIADKEDELSEIELTDTTKNLFKTRIQK